MRSPSPAFQRLLPLIGGGLVVLVIGFIFISAGTQFFYFLVRVEQQEVGVQFKSGQIVNIVGPGVYNDVGLYVEMKKVSSAAVSFSVRDEEIITADKQRIGLVVTGDAFRPNLAHVDVLRANWAQYSPIYLNDVVAAERVKALAQQAMKVCVGERKFDDAIIGTARDDLRQCIDDELSQLAENLGLQIENVVVPEVVLSPEVQAALDSIVASRLATEKAAQDTLKAEAEAEAEKAKQIGQIQVEQSRIQEEARQQIILAQLEQEKTIAQKAVIEAQKANELAQVEAQTAIIQAEKSNDLLAAQQDLEINKALALAAAEKAKADIAAQTVLAELYGKNPGYLQLRMAETNASALKATDKIIFTPVGTVPTIVLSGPGIQPTVNAAPVTPQ